MIVLSSLANPYGSINHIDVSEADIYNPTMLVFPNVPKEQRILMAVRNPTKTGLHPKLADFQRQSISGAFVQPAEIFRNTMYLPYMLSNTPLQTLSLPLITLRINMDRCENKGLSLYIGPEDARLFFTALGQPLMMYSQASKRLGLCRAMFIIDARVVFPNLTRIMQEGGWDPPIIFSEQTELRREGQGNVEKNWSPFIGENDELLLHTSLVPQLIYKYEVDKGVDQVMKPLFTNNDENCLARMLPSGDTVNIHQATPFIRATLCNRGECIPSMHNTVLFSMIHSKYEGIWLTPKNRFDVAYERRVLTMNTTSPYEYISLSKPMTYTGVDSSDIAYTTTLAWQYRDQSIDDDNFKFGHGYLDDELLISIGLGDKHSAYIDVLAEDLLSGHYGCNEN